MKESSIFSLPLASLTRLCCRNPVTVVVLSVLVAILSLYWTAEHLGFKMSRLDLINPNSGFNRLWLDYIDEFGDSNEVIVVVEGKSNVEVIPVLETLAERIARHPELYEGVLHGVDISSIRLKGLHYVPQRELEILDQFVDETTQITDGQWGQLCVDKMIDRMAQRLQSAQDPMLVLRTIRELESYSLSLSNAFGSSPCYGSPWPNLQGPQAAVPDVVAACSQNDTSYFLFPMKNGVMGFVLLKLADLDSTQLAQGKESIAKLRSIIAEVKEKNPTTQIGLTGMPIIENDEMQISSDSMSKATILALIGVGAVFMAGFGGIRHPALGMIGLLVAFAWTMGYITLSVGHLNILSVSFGAMLIGLGTDFSVHYAARYLENRRTGLTTEQALVRTASVVGPGVLTGALTTSAAFYMASFTEFTGVSELGTIAGGGVMLCALATFVLLPAMIQLTDGSKKTEAIPLPVDIRGFMKPAFRFPGTTMVLSTAAIIFLLFGIPHVWYDHNLLNLQPEGIECVELEQRLLNMDVEKGGKNVWFALSIAENEQELLSRKQQFAEKYPELKVEEIVSWFPGGDSKKIPIIESLSRKLAHLPERPPEISVADPESVGNSIGRIQQLLVDPRSPIRQMARHLSTQSRSEESSVASGQETELTAALEILEQSVPLIIRRLGEARESIRRMNGNEYRLRMAQYQSAVAGDLLTRLRIIGTMAIPEPPTIDDLPESLVERFVGRRGKHLMRIYTTANIWNMDEMQKFVEAVRDIDPKATGSPLQTYESSLQMQQGFISAAFYAFGAIVFFLFLDFRNLKDMIVAMMPMFVGFAMMFGILGWLNIPLNPANMIVLPLILGIGIDDGVHLVHDYRSGTGRFQLSSSTATAILITSLTAFIGFGSMMIASHRGLQSLGRVLVIGVSACLFTSLIILPVILSWWSRKRESVSRCLPDERGRPGPVTDDLEGEYAMEEISPDYYFEEYVYERELFSPMDEPEQTVEYRPVETLETNPERPIKKKRLIRRHAA